MYKRIFSNSILAVAGLLFLITGCRKTDDLTGRVDKINFVGDKYQINGPIDEWLFQNFTVPYNIKVQYKWDRSEVDLSKSMTPIDESKVIVVGERLLKYYLEPYQEEAGDYFVKRYPPKEYLLVGSAEYNTNGTVTVGSAHAGRKVTLFRLNEIEDDDWTAIQRMLKTVHHEFAHILDQNRAVPSEFGSINKADYVEDLWADFSLQEANDLGFVSPYARSSRGEDFAETVAILLVYGQVNFDNLVANAEPAGQNNLRKKEQMVIDYFKIHWDINFKSLQKRIEDLMPVEPEPQLPPLLESFGEGLQYTAIQVDESSVSESFLPLWNEINDEMVSELDRHIAYFKIHLMPGGTQIQVRVYRYPAGAGPTGSVAFSRLYFDIATNSDGILKLTYSESGLDGSNSSSATRGHSDHLAEFLEGHDFVWDWIDSNLEGGGLHVVDSNGEKTGVAFTGILQE